MKTWVRSISVSLMLLVLLCCSSRNSAVRNRAPDGGTSSLDERAVRQTLEDFIQAFNTLNYDHFISLFAAEATVFFPFDDRPLRGEGRDNIARMFGDLFDQTRKERTGPNFLNLHPEDVRVQLFGNTAVVTFHLKSGPVISRRTLVFNKHGDTWSIIHLHASNIRSEQ